MQAKCREAGTQIGASELILRSDGTLYHLGISEEHVADRVIIVGDPDRVQTIARMSDKVMNEVNNREFRVVRAMFGSRDITIISSGIGVDNIDIVLNELDAAVNIDLATRKVKDSLRQLEIVRIGTSGTIMEDIPVGSFVASRAAVGLDNVPHTYASRPTQAEADLLEEIQGKYPDLRAQYCALGDQGLLGRIGSDMIQGITITANGFYGPQSRSLRVLQSELSGWRHYGKMQAGGHFITNLEMECAGIYALSSMAGHKALTVCTILANRVKQEFHKEPSVSIESLIRQVLERI
jgi:uridine phosphorylase